MNFSFDAMVRIKYKKEHDIYQVSTLIPLKNINNLKIKTEILKTYISVFILY
jgi:hypothetical protein